MKGRGGGEVLAAASSGKLGNVLRRWLMGDDDNELQIAARVMAPLAPPPLSGSCCRGGGVGR